MSDLPAPQIDRGAVEKLQAELAKLPQAELETKHYFADGMYLRELLIPAGFTLVGKVHKREHFCIIASGDITIVGDGVRERIKAPRVLVSRPGAKRAGFAHEDTVFINVHRTAHQDLEEIERELIEPDEQALFDAYNKVIQGKLEKE